MADGDTHKHLEQNRPLILERAAVAGMMGLLPVPVIDDLLAGAVRGALLRRVATVRQVDADERALQILADASGDRLLGGVAGSRLTVRLLRGSVRKLASLMRVASRADDVATTFAVATLFDHYCSRHHVGAGVDEAQALRLRQAMEHAMSDARGALARRGARSVANGALSALASAPRAILRRAGLESKLLPAEAVSQIEPPPAPATNARTHSSTGNDAHGEAAGGVASALRMAAQASVDRVTALFGEAGRSWIDELVRAFDARWTSA